MFWLTLCELEIFFTVNRHENHEKGIEEYLYWRRPLYGNSGGFPPEA
jgi:hypothetical protein